MTLNNDLPAWGPPPVGDPATAVSVAKEQVVDLKEEVVTSAQQVEESAREETSNVIGETKSQAKDLFAQARGELHEQAAIQQSRAAEGLRAIGDELGEMAAAGSPGGLAGELVGQASSRADAVASWLDARQPGEVLDEVRAFAGRQPLAFLAIAAGAGVLAGRLARSLASPVVGAGAEAEESSSTPIYASVAHTHVAVPPVSASSTPTTPSASPVVEGWGAEGAS